MKQLRDIMFQCHPCVMCPKNRFHCTCEDTCNAHKNWMELMEHLHMLESENKRLHDRIDKREKAVSNSGDWKPRTQSDKLDKLLGKRVRIEFCDDQVLTGILHSTNEREFLFHPTTHFWPNFYTLTESTSNCSFDDSYIRKIEVIQNIDNELEVMKNE